MCGKTPVLFSYRTIQHHKDGKSPQVIYKCIVIPMKMKVSPRAIQANSKAHVEKINIQ